MTNREYYNSLSDERFAELFIREVWDEDEYGECFFKGYSCSHAPYDQKIKKTHAEAVAFEVDYLHQQRGE